MKTTEKRRHELAVLIAVGGVTYRNEIVNIIPTSILYIIVHSADLYFLLSSFQCPLFSLLHFHAFSSLTSLLYVSFCFSRPLFFPPLFAVLILVFFRRWLSSGLLRRAVWWKFTDVSEDLAAAIIRAMNVVWWKFTDVLEILAASIIRAMSEGMIEAASASETLVNLYQTTWLFNPEDSHLHTLRRENLKSY
jgi:hypothetical protein